MKILSIETSCDETAISLLDAKKTKGGFLFKVMGNALLSQTDLHVKYGGVFPMMAKREHSRNLVPILKQVVAQGFGISSSKFKISKQFPTSQLKNLKKLLEKEPDLLEQFLKEIPKIKKPKIDRIAVTSGPGLEPALWVGINFAKALSVYWDVPVVPVNHMEGHMFAALLQTADERRTNAEGRGRNSPQTIDYRLQTVRFPALGLLISGGHTELVLSTKWQDYKILGATRDDAVGEAFDKVARMMGLPYPGGPQISALAKFARTNAERTQNYAEKIPLLFASSQRNSASSLRQSARQFKLGSRASKFKLPRPMINSKDFDFSFSGLKTAVLYLIRDLTKQHSNILKNVGMKEMIAREFEDAVTEVLVTKTLRALKKFKVKTLLIGGGVSANERIRHEFTSQVKTSFPNTKLFLPNPKLSTDNAIMIGVAGFLKKTNKTKSARLLSSIRADGNLKLGG